MSIRCGWTLKVVRGLTRSEALEALEEKDRVDDRMESRLIEAIHGHKAFYERIRRPKGIPGGVEGWKAFMAHGQQWVGRDKWIKGGAEKLRGVVAKEEALRFLKERQRGLG